LKEKRKDTHRITRREKLAEERKGTWCRAGRGTNLIRVANWGDHPQGGGGEATALKRSSHGPQEQGVLATLLIRGKRRGTSLHSKTRGHTRGKKEKPKHRRRHAKSKIRERKTV